MNLEPTALVKNTIIEKQEALIDLLYREDTASDKMKALKHEVEEKQAVLQKRGIFCQSYNCAQRV